MEDLNKEEKIRDAISFLKSNGYKVTKDYDSMMIGKWVAFRKEGLSPILHGKIISLFYHGQNETGFLVRCKNGQHRHPRLHEIIGFFDDKKSCYAVK